MKAYILLEYTSDDKCKVHSLYTNRVAADGRAQHLYRQEISKAFRTMKSLQTLSTFHVITKTIKGKV